MLHRFCIAFVVVMALGATSATASFPGANGKIVYNACGSGPEADCGLFLINPDASGRTQVTHNPATFPVFPNLTSHGRDRRPSWSPDGQRIAYASERETGHDDMQLDLWVLHVPSGTQRQLTDTSLLWEMDPAWSPDGSRIAFVREADLWVMDASGNSASQLTNGIVAAAPDWSPDGSTIAFAVLQPDSGQHWEIYKVNADGTGLQPLTSSAPGQLTTSIDPSWSPDGSRILFARANRPDICCREPFDMFVMDSGGSNVVRLFTDSYIGRGIDLVEPAWSPDGTKFAYTRGGEVFDDVWVSSADAVTRTNVTNASGNDREPDWQPVVPRARHQCRGRGHHRGRGRGKCAPAASGAWAGP